MFIEFTTPEGLPMSVRNQRVLAFTGLEEGGTRIFLGGALSCIVSQDHAEVGRMLAGEEDAD